MFTSYETYIVFGIVAALLVWKWLKLFQAKKKMADFLLRGAVIVDVRSREEFQAASSPKSMNIPLDDINQGLKKIDSTKPLIVCCASGMRSAVAVKVFQKNGFKEVINIGSWRNIP